MMKKIVLIAAPAGLMNPPATDGRENVFTYDEFATVEEWEHDDQRELSLLFNHQPHDRPQFNRGQMRTAIRHGKRLVTPRAEVVADAVAAALAKFAVAYTHVTLNDMSTSGRSWKVHETGHGNPFEHGVWLGEFDTKEAANGFCAALRKSAAVDAARTALATPATSA
jgi:hypothetical protein